MNEQHGRYSLHYHFQLPFPLQITSCPPPLPSVFLSFSVSLSLLFKKYNFLSSPLQLQCFGHQSPLPAIFIYLVTLTLCEAEHFQSKLILKVPKDVILIYSLSPLNGTACFWQEFSRVKEHTIRQSLFSPAPVPLFSSLKKNFTSLSKIRPKVCEGALIDVSHLACYISFMAASGHEEQRKNKRER